MTSNENDTRNGTFSSSSTAETRSNTGCQERSNTEEPKHISDKDALDDESVEEAISSNNILDKIWDITVENPYHPIHWPVWQKYVIVIIYSLLQVFVTMNSTSYVSVEWWIEERYGVTAQVATLGQSMFIMGTAVGPAFLGPLSDISGRKWVYVGSMIFYAIFNIGCALPLNLPMFVIFMFLSGISGSTSMANVAGTVSDLFVDSDSAAQPMGIFVMSANIGPSLGSPVGEWIGDNANMGFRWVYYLNIIIAGGFAIIMSFVPETLPVMVIQKETKRELDASGRSDEFVEYKADVLRELRFIFIMAFKLMLTEPIILSLGLYTGFSYGLLFLYLDGVFDVFVYNNGLSYIGADLTYMNITVAVIIMFCFIPIQTWFYKRQVARNGGVGKPEFRFLTSLVFVWGFPISLFWFAFTSDGSVNYWSCVVAGGVLGFSNPLLWLAMLNYVTDSYPHTAGSAIAAFEIPSFAIGAAAAHAGIAMFENLSTTWAMATLGFISLTVVVLVYVFYFFGEKIRLRSKIARH